MPKRRRRTKSSKRSTSKYKRRRIVAADSRRTLTNADTMSIYRAPSNFRGPLPQKIRATMILNHSSSLAANLTNADVVAYGLNDCYNPTGSTGNQPRGFDQMMALYDHFVVIGAKAEIWAENIGPSSAMLIATVRDSNSFGADAKDYMESRQIKAVALHGASRNAGNTASNVLHSGGPSHGYLSLSLNPNKWLGIGSPLSASQARGSVAASPSELVYLHLASIQMDNVNTTAHDINYQVRIIYDVMLIEPKQVAAS